MDDDRHAIPIRRLKHSAQPLNVLGIVVVDDGVRKMQLEARILRGLLRTVGKFIKGVVSERIDTAEPQKPVTVKRHLLTGPVVLVSNPFAFVFDCSLGAAKDVCR
jgi:hypothetical protein